MVILQRVGIQKKLYCLERERENSSVLLCNAMITHICPDFEDLPQDLPLQNIYPTKVNGFYFSKLLARLQ